MHTEQANPNPSSHNWASQQAKPQWNVKRIYLNILSTTLAISTSKYRREGKSLANEFPSPPGWGWGGRRSSGQTVLFLTTCRDPP